MPQPSRLTTQLLDGNQWSKDLRWNVTLRCDNRGNVYEVESQACYGYSDGASYGYARQAVGPFDSLSTIMSVTMVDAAVNCSDQLVLFNQP